MSDTARYIDAEELYKKIFPMDVVDKRQYSINAKAVAEAIDKTPTADVAPRAEVAREIFVEIRNILNKHYYACYQNEDGDECDAVISYLSYVAVDFDRIEQKYTGADPEPPKGDHHE